MFDKPFYKFTVYCIYNKIDKFTITLISHVPGNINLQLIILYKYINYYSCASSWNLLK